MHRRQREEKQMRRAITVVSWLAVAVLSTGVLAACSSSDEDSGTSASATQGANAVDVTLQEFAIGTVPTAGAAGTITFTITNNGPDDAHEFVVIKTDLAATDLPTVADGSVDEEGAGIEPVDEVEEIPVGTTETLSVDLDAGNYVFICNVVEKEEGEVISHYQNGMRTSFTVS
jgi:uncharacterized cupredoxin-like copper-binding protein